MKHVLFPAAILIIIAGSSCQKDAPLYSPALEAQLKNLRQVPVSNYWEQDSIRRLVKGSAEPGFPVLSPEGKRLTPEELKNQRVNKWFDCFVDSLNQIKAIVCRPATQQEIDMRLGQMDQKNNTYEQRVARWVGQQAPAITATDIKGNRVSPESLKGKIVVLNFWFARCHPCQQEMPELNRLVAEFKQKDIVFLGLTFDSESDTRNFLSRTAFDYQVLPNAKFYFDQFGLGPCPVNMVIDANGYISYTEMGYEAGEQASYEGLRKAILHSIRQKGKP